MSVPVRPGLPALRTTLALLGRVLVSSAVLHLPGIVVAFVAGEHRDATAMVLAGSVAVVAGMLLRRQRASTVTTGTGAVVVASAWAIVPAVVAISFHLSGHTGSYLDSYFDAMSGLTTSGLSVMQDLDHVGVGMQTLRHMLHFAGGQGIVLAVLTLLENASGGISTLMSGEGRDQRLVPNVVRTARLIWLIAFAWLIVGTTALTIVLRAEGFDAVRALLHGAMLFAAAFDTGGFSMMSTSVAYYHSAPVEAVLAVLMVAGALSFPVHYGLWRRRWRHVGRDIGLRTFATTTALLTVVAMVGATVHGALDGTVPLLRTIGFTMLSAATGTGFAVVPGSVLSAWGSVAPAAVVAVMAIGAMAGSTAGGVKVERVAVMVKAVARDVRRAIAPPGVVVIASRPGAFGGPRVRLADDVVRAAATTTILFLATYLGGALVAVYYGASVEAALFESVSATATVGLSVGVTAPGAPVLVRSTTIAQMYLGRLEFVAAFALAGWIALRLRDVVPATSWRHSSR